MVLLSVGAAIAFAVLWALEQKQTYQLTIATASKDGEYYAFAQALANVVERHDPKIDITVLETKGSPENMQLLEQGRVNLAIVQNDTPVTPSVRAIAYLFPEVFHLVAAADTDIQTVADLKGKRIALMPEGSGSYALFWPLSRHYGLAETDFEFVSLGAAEAHTAFRAGEVDALFRVLALGNPSISELLSNTQARLIPIDQATALRLSFPYLEATQIPKGTYDGAIPTPPTDLPVVGVRAVLVSHADVNPEVVRAIAQTLFEFRNELVAQYPRAANITLPESSMNLGLPMHPGARAYYDQDEPSFLVEYAEPIGLLLSVSILIFSGVWQFRLWLKERQKNRADMYNLEILGLIDDVQKSVELEQLNQLRRYLFEILHKVVVDLDEDRISPQSFQSFAFTWEMAIATIRHREVVLLNLYSKQELSSEQSVKQ